MDTFFLFTMQGYIPLNTDRQKNCLDRKRNEYSYLVNNHEEDILGTDELAVLHQIKIDLPRTVVFRRFLEYADIRLYEREHNNFE